MNLDPAERRKVTVFAESEDFFVAQAPNGFIRVCNKETKEQVFFATTRKCFPKEKLQKLAEWFQQGGEPGFEALMALR